MKLAPEMMWGGNSRGWRVGTGDIHLWIGSTTGQPHIMIRNHNVSYNIGKGRRRGTAKTFWDSPLEETSEEKQRKLFE